MALPTRLGFRVLGFRVLGLAFRVWGLGLGLRDWDVVLGSLHTSYIPYKPYRARAPNLSDRGLSKFVGPLFKV